MEERVLAKVDAMQEETQIEIKKIVREAVKSRKADELQLDSREDIQILLNRFQFKTMLDIGVQSGQFADQILSQWPAFEHYYGVDLW
jgi:hypothetical protein